MPIEALAVTVEDRPGMLFHVTKALAQHDTDVRHVEIMHRAGQTALFFEYLLSVALEQALAASAAFPA